MKFHPIWILAAFLSTVVLVVAPATAQEEQKEEEKLTQRQLRSAIKLADKKLKEGDLATAGGWYLRIVTDYPEKHDIQLRLARIYYELKDWGAAANSFRIAGENLSGKDQVEAYTTMTDALVKLGFYEQAVEAGRKAVELNPSDASVHSNLAMSLAKTGSFQEAADEARKALELEPTSALAHAALGEVQSANGNVDDAQASFQKALEYDPTNADSHAGLADIHLKREEWDSAVAEATKALELNDGLARAYSIRGLANNAKGDHAAANEDLAMAVTVNPNDADIQYAYAQALVAQGNEDRAANYYRKAFRLNPALTGAGLSLAEGLVGRGSDQEAQQVLTQVIDREPDSAQAHHLLGMAQNNLNQPDAAIGEFAKAAELDPSLAAAYYWHGKLLLEKKQDVAGAFPLLKKAVEMEGENVDFLSDYGVALVSSQQFDEAVTVLSKAAASPDYRNPAGLYNLGAAYLNQQNFVEATGPFQRAVEAFPTWGPPHMGLAWATFAQIPKGCPCGPEDEERVRIITEHYMKAVELGVQDAALKERVDVLGRGEKIK